MRLEDIRIDPKFAARLPEPSAGEFEGLCESIERYGILAPLAVSETGMLLDGHRRYRAAKKLGLKSVPTKTLDTKGAKTWGKAFAIIYNLSRRRETPEQILSLGSSLLRIERADAKKRQAEGRREGGKTAGRGRKALGTTEPKAINPDDNKATARHARKLGVSRRQVEDYEYVRRHDPETHAKVERGEKRLPEAKREVTQKKIKAEAEAEERKLKRSGDAGKVKTLEELAGKCRTVLMDPPWSYGDEGCSGAAARIYPTMTNSELAALPVGELAHSAGCLYWIWTTWPMIRDRVPHELIESWNLRWVGELVWVKPGLGVGRWLRPATEVCILAVHGKPRLLETTGLKALIETDKRLPHSKKPPESYQFIERISAQPSLEMFAREARPWWTWRWGNEA